MSNPPALLKKLLGLACVAIAATAHARAQAHTSAVSSIAYSPSGRTIAFAGRDASVRLLDATTGVLRREFRGHTGDVTFVAFAGDSKIVSCGADGTVRVWDSETGLMLRLVEVGPRPTYFAFSPTAQTLLAGDGAQFCGVWDINTGARLRSLKMPPGYTIGAGFLPDGKSVLLAGNYGLALFPRAGGRRVWPLADFSTEHVAVSPTGRHALVVSRYGRAAVKLFDFARGRLVRRFPKDFDRVACAAFAPRGDRILIAGTAYGNATAGGAAIRPVARGGTTRVVITQTRGVSAATFSPDGRRVVTGGDDGAVRVWDAFTGRLITDFGAANEPRGPIASFEEG